MEGTLNSLSQLTGSLSVSVTSGGGGSANYSDSGDSTGARSTDNATPPMHFLTPHVEISMADAPVPGFSPTPVSILHMFHYIANREPEYQFHELT